MKVNVGEVLTASSGAETEDVQTSFIDEYVKSVARDKRVPGEADEKKKAAFEEMLNEAIEYQKLNGGLLTGETDDYEGFMVYKTDAVAHYPGDGQMSEFWGKAFSAHKEYSMAAANGVLEIFIHELFIKTKDKTTE